MSPRHFSRQHFSWGYLSISAISQLLLAQFGSNFKQRVLGTYTTDYNCYHGGHHGWQYILPAWRFLKIWYLTSNHSFLIISLHLKAILRGILTKTKLFSASYSILVSTVVLILRKILFSYLLTRYDLYLLISMMQLNLHSE